MKLQVKQFSLIKYYKTFRTSSYNYYIVLHGYFEIHEKMYTYTFVPDESDSEFIQKDFPRI